MASANAQAASSSPSAAIWRTSESHACPCSSVVPRRRMTCAACPSCEVRTNATARAMASTRRSRATGRVRAAAWARAIRSGVEAENSSGAPALRELLEATPTALMATLMVRTSRLTTTLPPSTAALADAVKPRCQYACQNGTKAESTHVLSVVVEAAGARSGTAPGNRVPSPRLALHAMAPSAVACRRTGPAAPPAPASWPAAPSSRPAVSPTAPPSPTPSAPSTGQKGHVIGFERRLQELDVEDGAGFASQGGRVHTQPGHHAPRATPWHS